MLQEREGKAARVGYVAVEIFREGGWLGGEPKKKKFYGEKRGWRISTEERAKQWKKEKRKKKKISIFQVKGDWYEKHGFTIILIHNIL